MGGQRQEPPPDDPFPQPFSDRASQGTFVQQVVQSIRNGELSIAEVPAPRAHAGEVLIANRFSLVSAGTEKMLIDFGKKSVIGKARARPQEVKRVLKKVRQDGLIPTVQAVCSRLDEPMKMGYASSGVVLSCGPGVDAFRPGDRVASNGPHAGVVAVPVHLCAHVPEEVSLEHAAFTVLGAIALQGVRLAKIQIGETVLVIGLGLVGQLTVALLKAAGCRVVGTDPEAAKCEVARTMGAEIARPGIRAADLESMTGGVGADAVLIAASTTSNGPIQLAADSVRQKGRVVLVGVVGLELDRDPFFRKEAEFVVSCSYGPGRYDADYEIEGHDYPVGHVRWTEQRNLQAVLDCMASGGLDVAPLITHRFPIGEASGAYELIRAATEPFLGVLLQHPCTDVPRLATTLELRAKGTAGEIGVGVVGAGSFARDVLIPRIAACKRFHAVAICSKGGLTASTTGTKHGFRVATTDAKMVLRNEEVDAVFVVTQHHLHADQVIESIRHGKHVFVEKPLCISADELRAIEDALEEAGDRAPIVTVGFNRRFSRSANITRQFFADVTTPITLSYRFNAGALPPDHWTQNPEIGGGRIIGEACHAIDTATSIIGSPPVRVHATSIAGQNAPAVTDDQCFITLTHADGSISSIAYLAGGDAAFPRERIEVIGAGRIAIIDDFRKVTTVRHGKTRVHKHRKDKGHGAEIQEFAAAIANGDAAPIPWTDLRAVTLASILAVRSMREQVTLDIP